MLPLIVPEPYKARLVAADRFHQLLLWLDVQLEVFKNLQLPVPLYTFKDFFFRTQFNHLPFPPFLSLGKRGLKLSEMAKLILAFTAVQS